MLALVSQFPDIRAPARQHLRKSSSVLISEQTRALYLFAVASFGRRLVALCSLPVSYFRCSAIYPSPNLHTANRSACDTNSRDVPTFALELHRKCSDAPKIAQFIPNFKGICRLPFGIIIVRRLRHV